MVAAHLKYLAPNPFHLGLNHSSPSTFISVGLPNNLVMKPNGPFETFKTTTASIFEKTTCQKAKKECIGWLNILEAKVGIYIKRIPFNIFGFCENK